jgi:4-amino-4-deoxy-L-arabinose transferase-like glycosyltransferase/predicted negative regulator of RcsB-dependent stress response
MKARQASVNAQFQWAIRAAILLVALVLRGYRLTGFVLNQDEAHWLLYSLNKNLLFESLKNSHPRPEVLFPILSSLPIRLFGPNELAMRLLCALAGSFSIFPLESFVKRLTKSNTAALAAAALFAVSPLHVHFSSQGIPDVIALFFLLCALACFARAAETNAKIDFVMFGSCLALALVSKANSLYFWLCLWVISALFFRDSRQRNMSLLALGGAAIPLVALSVVIKMRSPTLSFFQEPGVTTRFTITLGKIGSELSLCWLFLGVSIIASTLGALLLATRERSGLSHDVIRARLWAFLTPLVMLLVAPYFRVTAKDLLLLLPTVCLFGAVALHPITPMRSLLSVVVLGASLGRCLWGIPMPAPPRPSSAMARTTAVLARPAGWPSRDASRWLASHTTSEDAVLVTAFTFTDPLVLELQAQRKVISNAGSNWELLRDPANRIKYVVFIEDYRAYAAQFAQFADAHFSSVPDADFPNYTIYDCQRGGRFVAYPDAFNSSGLYVQRGVKLLEQKRCDEAIEAFKSALHGDASSLAAKHDLMTAYLECDRQNDAARIGAELLQQEPADPTLNVNMAILYLELGRLDDGLAQCRRNIHLNIAPAISYGVLGQLLEKRGDLSAARDAYEKSLALDSNNPVTTILLSNVLVKLRHHAPVP